MMSGMAYLAAEQYFQVAEQDYVPLLLKGDREDAKNVLLSRMRPLYEAHAAAVDQIVAVATREARDGEVLAASKVRLYTSVMAGVGIVILLAGGLLSFSLAQRISKQTEELQRSFDELRALAARLQSVREDERKRLAREIHDQLGQTLRPSSWM
jgi:signal transduction histidine kinase